MGIKKLHRIEDALTRRGDAIPHALFVRWQMMSADWRARGGPEKDPKFR